MEPLTLYHASPVSRLGELRPSVTRYFDKPRQVCLTSCLPMALLYGVDHFEYPYGYTREGRICYEEYFPNALREVYGGKSASLYRCAWREDMETTQIPNEYVTLNPVPVLVETPVPDVYAALLEQEGLGALTIVRYQDMTERRLAWVREAEAQVILENDLLHVHQDDPFARYLREYYPDSWALAQAREKER